MQKNKINENEYVEIHFWLRKNFGNANKCENPECKNKSQHYEWALLKGKKYEFNRDNFMQLCKSCHSYYDRPGFEGKKHSEETKNKMRERRLGKSPWNKGLKNCYTKEWCKMISEVHKGKALSEETRKKISLSSKGKKHSEDWVNKIANSRRGKRNSKPMSEETKMKIKNSLKIFYNKKND